MKVVLTFIAFTCCSVLSVFGQERELIEKRIKEGKIITLSNGKFDEIHINDSLQKIGSAIVNIYTGTIYELLETDTVYSEATLDPTVISRWYSLDPLMSKFPWMSPYVAFNNNPVIFIDPYGLESVIPGEDEPDMGPALMMYDGKGNGDDNNWELRGTYYAKITGTEIVDKRASEGQTITLPEGVETKYSPDGKTLNSFKYCFPEQGLFAHMEYREFKGHYDESMKMMLYTSTEQCSGNDYYHYTSNHVFDKESEGYTYMWQNTYNHNGTVNSEQIAYITEDGKVHVSTNAFNQDDMSFNMIKTTTKDDVLYANGSRVLATIHTHPNLQNSGDGLFSGGDKDCAALEPSAFMIQMNYFNVVQIGFHNTKTNQFELLDVPTNMTRENIMNGTVNLSEYLKGQAYRLKP